ncbi:MAG: hypothetical protein VYB34_16525 [Planctomycetota bacterium]|nr:hypothetical protein [Planctomycetota bacterium]
MMKSLLIRALLPAVVLTACTGLLFAGDSSKKKVPSPYSQLAKAARNLSKIKGFKTTLTVQGGLSNTKDHKIHQFAVKETYQGDIYKGLLHVSAKESFKTPRKGVRFFEGAWRNIHSDPQGKMLQTFFNFPQEVLKQALRHAKKSGRWLDADQPAAEAEKNPARPAAEELEIELEDSGRTVVSKKPLSGEEAEAIMPTVMLVQTPTREALNHYLAVENSGCLGGG